MAVDQPIRILVVEDEPDDQALITRYLMRSFEQHRYTLLTVSTLAGAVAATLGTRFDVATLDLGLPDGAGIDTVRVLHQAAPWLSLLVVSGTADLVMTQACLSAGAQGFLTKAQLQADPDLLVQEILCIVRRARRPLLPAEAPADPSVRPAVTILHVEDDRSTARLVAHCLREEIERGEIGLIQAATLTEALFYLQDPCPDAVLLDLGLPGVEELEALEAVMERCPDSPVVVLTGQGEGVRGACLDLGASGFLLKPPDRDVLLPALHEAIDGRMAEIRDVTAGARAARVREYLGRIQAAADALRARAKAVR